MKRSLTALLGLSFLGLASSRAATSYVGFSFTDRVESAIANSYNGLTQSFRNIAPGVDMRITTSSYGAATYNFTKSFSSGDIEARYTSSAGWNAASNPVAGSNPLGINYTLNFYEADATHTFSIAKVLSNFRLLTYDVDGSSNTSTTSGSTNGVPWTTTTRTIIQSEAVRVLAGSGFVSYQLTPDSTITAVESGGNWQFNGDNVNVNYTLPSMVIMNFADTSEVCFQFEAPYSRDANDPVATYLDGDMTYITADQLATFADPASVPEPSALSLLSVCLGGLAMMRRRRS